ncbi:hypothetical protein FXO38_23918 [Capsicum annuum]|nr:hypothetical protein FXO38_23918 [Capsicum annuum]
MTASPIRGPPTPLQSRRSACLPLLQRHQQPPIDDNSSNTPAPLHTTTRPHSLHELAPAATILPPLRSGFHLQQSRNTNDDEPVAVEVGTVVGDNGFGNSESTNDDEPVTIGRGRLNGTNDAHAPGCEGPRKVGDVEFIGRNSNHIMAIPTSYPKFGIVWCTPPHMKYWWSNLGYYGQSVVEKALGSLPSLININPCRQLIEAATAFWDETRSVFRFGDVEMTPLLEEIGGYIENKMFPKEMRWQQTEVIVPKSVTLEEQATNWVSMAAD